MKKKNSHKQTWIKVNTHVDESIKDLITALNLFPKLRTIESCEGDNNHTIWVCFCYGEDQNNSWKELADFVLKYFGPIIVYKVGDRVEISIRVTGSGGVMGELSVRRGAISIVTKAITEIYRENIVS